MRTTAEVPVEPTLAADPRQRRIVLAPGPWRNAVSAGLGSLLGILLAFAIDAWWDTRGERAKERAYLNALGSELAHARAAIEENKASLANQIDFTRRTVTVLSAPSAASLPSDSIQAIANLAPYRLFIPPRAALDDLIHSGGMVLIRSDSLRRELASYQQALARDLSEQEALIEIWLTHLAPYRYRHGSMQSLAHRFQIADLGYEIDRGAFVGNRDFANLVIARMARLNDVIRSHDALITRIDHILPMLKGR